MDQVIKNETSQTIGKGPVGKEGYTVKQGDCMESIAYSHGFFWETLWNLPENDELRETRKDPNVLLPGDKVFIPKLRIKEESCAEEECHRFRQKGVPAKIVIRFEVDGEPRADEPYFVVIDGKRSNGRTDDEGIVELFISPGAKKGRITFPESEREYDLVLGGLDPITELSGVQGRLMDLGFFPGPVDNKMSPELTEAVRTFQEKNDLEATGTLDKDTLQTIDKVFGG